MEIATEIILRVWSRRALTVAGAAAACAFAAACKDNTSPAKPTPSAVVANAPDTLIGVVGATLDTPIVVRVNDASGHPLQGTIVAFTVSPENTATVLPANPTTDDSGLARTTVTLGTTPGLDTVTAQVVSATPPTPLVFFVVATAGPPAQAAPVSGDQQTAPAGTALPDSLIAQVTDQFGNPLSGVHVTWFSSGAGMLGTTSSTTDANGMSGTTYTLSGTRGLQSVTAEVSPSIEAVFSEVGQ